jgi:hypothetical protein
MHEWDQTGAFPWETFKGWGWRSFASMCGHRCGGGLSGWTCAVIIGGAGYEDA